MIAHRDECVTDGLVQDFQVEGQLWSGVEHAVVSVTNFASKVNGSVHRRRGVQSHSETCLWIFYRTLSVDHWSVKGVERAVIDYDSINSIGVIL